MPSAFDRILATRLTHRAVVYLEQAFRGGNTDAVFMGMADDGITAQPVTMMSELLDMVHRRPREQWWLPLRLMSETVSLENAELQVRRIQIAGSAPAAPGEQRVMKEAMREGKK